MADASSRAERDSLNGPPSGNGERDGQALADGKTQEAGDKTGDDEAQGKEAKDENPGDKKEVADKKDVTIIHAKPATTPEEKRKEDDVRNGKCTPQQALEWFQRNSPWLKEQPTWDGKMWMFPQERPPATPGPGAGGGGKPGDAGGGSGGGKPGDAGGGSGGGKPGDAGGGSGGGKPGDAGGGKPGDDGGGRRNGPADGSRLLTPEERWRRDVEKYRDADDKKLASLGTSRQQVTDQVTMTNGDFINKYGVRGWWNYPRNEVRNLPVDVLRRVIPYQDPTLYQHPSGRVGTNADETHNKVAHYNPPQTALGGAVRGGLLLGGASAGTAEQYGNVADGVQRLIELGVGGAAWKEARDRRAGYGKGSGEAGKPGEREVHNAPKADPPNLPGDPRWGGKEVPLGKPSGINESPGAARLGPELIVGGANPDKQGGIQKSIRPSIGEGRAYDWATRSLNEKGLERPEHVNKGGRGDFITSRDDGKAGLQIVVTDVKTINPESKGGTPTTKTEMPDTWTKRVADAIERMPDGDPDKGKLQQAFNDGNIVLRNVVVDYRPGATVGRDSAPVSVISESQARR